MGGKILLSFPISLKTPGNINLTANIIPISSGGSSRALLVGALAVQSQTCRASALGEIFQQHPVSLISVFQDFQVPRVDAAERDLGSAGKGWRKPSGSVCPVVWPSVRVIRQGRTCQGLVDRVSHRGTCPFCRPRPEQACHLYQLKSSREITWWLSVAKCLLQHSSSLLPAQQRKSTVQQAADPSWS